MYSPLEQVESYSCTKAYFDFDSNSAGFGLRVFECLLDVVDGAKGNTVTGAL